jgi:glycosyltransferase involved in cell wall biosynthesis
MLSLVCPAHNEAANIAPLLHEWHRALERLKVPFEIIVVDDGSTDRTAQEVHGLCAKLPGVRLVRCPARCGQSAALANGIARAGGDAIVTCDADLQNDPADLPLMLASLDRCDVVCGWRQQRHDNWIRRMTSRAANAVIRRLFGHHVHDTGCALKVFRREVAERILQFDGTHRFFAILAVIEGFRVREVPVHHRPRLGGHSKYGLLNRLVRTVHDLCGVDWYRRRRIKRPEQQHLHFERAEDATPQLDSRPPAAQPSQRRAA